MNGKVCSQYLNHLIRPLPPEPGLLARVLFSKRQCGSLSSVARVTCSQHSTAQKALCLATPVPKTQSRVPWPLQLDALKRRLIR